MANMSYCRHENTGNDLAEVWELWDDYVPGANEYEDKARVRIIKLVRDMHDQFEFDGTYEEVS